MAGGKHACRLRRGDNVMVITGADRGKQGRVLRVLHEAGQVVVEGVNLVYRHVRRSQQNPQGGRVRREAPVNISNVMLVDPKENVPTRVGKALVDPEKGSLGWTRIAKKSGADLSEDAVKASKKGSAKKKSKKSKEPKE